jgi:hypothetical protein
MGFSINGAKCIKHKQDQVILPFFNHKAFFILQALACCMNYAGCPSFLGCPQIKINSSVWLIFGTWITTCISIYQLDL